MFDVSIRSYDGAKQARAVAAQINQFREQLRERQARIGTGALADAIAALDQKAAALAGTGGGGRRRGRRGGATQGAMTLSRLESELLALMQLVEEADAAPTSQLAATHEDLQDSLADLLARWKLLKSKDVPAVNTQLKAANLPLVELP
jgi:hypothetical protein